VISLYYAGRFADCKTQFESHRTVNPEDFENAAWHMLCAARINGPEAARKSLIPIRKDTRTPMKELHALWRGQANKGDVLSAAGQEKAGRFYAQLYLALWEEANGRREQSRSHAKVASELAGPDYMGDVARVHWEALREGKLP
jgi:lipoprotein NlpI